MRVVVLTYHSHNIFGTEYGQNDHVSLAIDLELIHSAGARIVRLDTIAEAVAAGRVTGEGPLFVGLSFDDGPIFDICDFVHPLHGPQRSMRTILEEFRSRHRAAKHDVHATSFVIASPQARKAMERAEECGYPYIDGWLSDEWWGQAARSDIIGIGNHSWDHVHHVAEKVAIASAVRDNFALVKTYPEADAEIRRASRYIAHKIDGTCGLFAYPFGHSNDYLAKDYLPNRRYEHELRAAFGASGGEISDRTSVWDIPRIVCGLHWRTPGELESLLVGDEAT